MCFLFQRFSRHFLVVYTISYSDHPKIFLQIIPRTLTRISTRNCLRIASPGISLIVAPGDLEWIFQGVFLEMSSGITGRTVVKITGTTLLNPNQTKNTKHISKTTAHWVCEPRAESIYNKRDEPA